MLLVTYLLLAVFVGGIFSYWVCFGVAYWWALGACYIYFLQFIEKT